VKLRSVVAVGAASAVSIGMAVAGPTTIAQAAPVQLIEYTVLGQDGASDSAVHNAVRAAGGTVLEVNSAVGMYTVRAPENGFTATVSRSSAVVGAARLRPIGWTPGAKIQRRTVENEGSGSAGAAEHDRGPKLDPFDDKLWGLKMVKADKARKVQSGSHRVLVGVLDSGIDASNPDLAPNFNWKLSRNFVTDIPTVNGADFDGPCEFVGCVDPIGWDDNGHGTHVSGTIAAAANGIGVSGVAPSVSLVEIRGGQDAGFLFLGPVVNALTYGADVGLDVINMSFYVDPWLYNCAANAADTPEQQSEQRAIIQAMNRALNYAHRKGVTLVGSLGNNHEDLGNPRTDISSPDFPPGTEHDRPIDNATCVDLPVEGPHVIGVSALGPSGRKADYSNYGTEQISVAAPGGWFRDGLGTDTYRTIGNEILSTYPKKPLQEQGLVDADGNITPAGVTAGVLKDCANSGQCGFYFWLQGTSMASPHTTGVAALIVSEYGRPDHRNGGLTMDPDKVERVLLRSAAEHACPTPALQSYVDVGRSAEFDALCEGTTGFNGFYGSGIVDAYAAVTINRGHGH
jgi:subtilisin family serine protease